MNRYTVSLSVVAENSTEACGSLTVPVEVPDDACKVEHIIAAAVTEAGMVTMEAETKRKEALVAAVQQWLAHSPNDPILRRTMVAFLLNAKVPHVRIAEAVGLSDRQVRNIRERVTENPDVPVSQLWRDAERTGRPPNIREEHLGLVCDCIVRLTKAGKSAASADIATMLDEVYSIKVSGATMRRYVSQYGLDTFRQSLTSEETCIGTTRIGGG